MTLQSLVTIAAAQGLDAARTAFAQGAFLDAAALARPLGTSDGAALAARAELAQGDFLATSATRRSNFEQAEKDARTAIALDPNNPEGHLYLALALGFLGRMDGSIAAHFAGYAAEARAHIDKALALAPDSPWPHALSGGWNLEIVHDGGMLGETLYGASLEKGCADYARALEIDPRNTAIAYQYALQLSAMGTSQRRAQATRVLGIALQSAPGNALEVLSRRRAQRLKLVLDTHDDVGLKAIIRDQLGTPAQINGGSLHPLGADGAPR
ncbi:MAG TPA: hypothetical protein VF449_12790 [Parvibaculum sp.]